MPIYEYHCSSCGFQKEYLRKLSDPLLSVCPACSKETFGKMLTAAAFQLKGSGWYVTDFKNNGAKAEAKAAGKSDAAGKAGHKAEQQADHKPDQVEHKAEQKTEHESGHKAERKTETANESKTKRGGKTETRPVAATPAPAGASKAG